VQDNGVPSVALIGAASINVECHTAFVDPGTTASDVCDPAPAVARTGVLNTNALGTYTLTYTATDGGGNQATTTRQVVVVDSTAPVVTVTGGTSVTVECHGVFSDPGATANDSCAAGLSVTPSGSVNTDQTGLYTLTYSATDPSSNTGTATRVVHVTDSGAPTLVGVPAAVTVQCDSIPTVATVTATFV